MLNQNCQLKSNMKVLGATFLLGLSCCLLLSSAKVISNNELLLLKSGQPVRILKSQNASSIHLNNKVPLLNPGAQPRVVGGQDSYPGEFPYQVSLQWAGVHFCGGSLLGRNWVLTAAHCIDAIPQTLSDLTIKAGKYHLHRWDSSEQEVSVYAAYIHGGFQGNVSPYDIALIRLQRSFQYSGNVQYIDLPSPGSDPGLGKWVVLSGWGATATGSGAPNILQRATLPIVSRDVCHRQIIQLTGGSVVDWTNICTGPLGGGYSICAGDSGGPLVLNENGRRTVVGIVSWGITPCGTAGAPSVYVRVGAFVNFINEVIAGNGGW